MSITGRRLVLAFFCTSALAATLPVSGADALSPTTASLDAEVALARRPGVYLVIDPCSMQLDVKARGFLLESLPLRDVQVLTFRPLIGEGGAAAELQLPATLKVAEGPPWPERGIEAPATLRPYTGDESAPTSPPGTTPTPIPTATPLPLAPVRYTVGMEDGWRLEVAPTIAARNPLRRFATAVADSWHRLHHTRIEHPPSLAVAVDPEAAREIFHLFQPGIRVLVMQCTQPEQP